MADDSLRTVSASALHIVDGELKVWGSVSNPNVIVFGITSFDDDAGPVTYSVAYERDKVAILIEHLTEWLRRKSA